MKAKQIRIALRSKPVFKKIILALLILAGSGSLSVYGDIYHYKNFVAGARSALMGGAYSAISDDAAGAYYNPAGIAFSFGDSLSGSANAFHNVNTKYKKAIKQTYDWERESSALLPNFFGMIKKYGKTALAISYVVPETQIEHQDQTYLNPSADLSKYNISLHSEDSVYMVGPSLSRKISESFSVGMSLHYYYREFRSQQNEYLEFTNSSTRLNYKSTKVIEHGISPRLGMQFNMGDTLVFGLMYDQTTLTSASYSYNNPYSIYDSANSSLGTELNSESNSNQRKLPSQLTMGMAYYPTPFMLFSTDLDYYKAGESTLEDVLNISMGSEIFFDAKNSIRFGLFTNNDSRPAVSSSTSGNEHIDMMGYSFGYASYSRSSSLTIGAVYSSGDGKSQIYGDADSRDMHRESLTMVFAATYNY